MSETRTASAGLAERFANITNRINEALQRSNRPAEDLTLIAISKTHPASVVSEAIKVGATDLGENRVQEAEEKILEVGRNSARWHLVGHLQANKAKRAVKLFDVIHSLDSAELAGRLDRLCEEEAVNQLSVLIQVDLGEEETKSGIAEDQVVSLAQEVDKCKHLELIGLMTLPPFFEDPNEARPFFKRLAQLRDKLAQDGLFKSGRGELSMGMTHDFEVAIEEGATMVRIGTAIFGERGR
ncbi:MAG TPA: YggS family pyridoxal phosphate-dependent enzyme [Pyrinomonadaceae bacterium]